MHKLSKVDDHRPVPPTTIDDGLPGWRQACYLRRRM